MAKEESKVVERIKEEAARIGESTIYSSKSHFNMAPKWKNWHYLLGIVSIVLSVSVTSGRAIFPDVPIDVVSFDLRKIFINKPIIGGVVWGYAFPVYA